MTDTIRTTRYLRTPSADGRPVKVTLTFQGFNSGPHILAGRGVEIHYVITDGTSRNTLAGSDGRTPVGFNTTVDDIVRSLASSLIFKSEVFEGHEGGQRCDDCYRAAEPCAVITVGAYQAIEALREPIESASWTGQPA